MLTVARAVVARLINGVAFLVIIIGGVAAGCALNIAEDVDSEIKKRIGAHRSHNSR